jgi:aquaglyceroporin related protein, other eukaryote
LRPQALPLPMPQTAASAELPKSQDWVEDGSPVRLHHEYVQPASPLDNMTTISAERSDGTNGIVHSEKTSSGLRKTRSALGLHPDAPIDEEHDIEERQKLLWPRIRIILREPFAEFWGTLIMVMFGDGSVAQVLLSTGQTAAPGGNGFGAYQSISWG